MIVPLNKIGFSREGHKSALWWLGLLYRRPKEFRESLEGLSLRESIFVFFKILLPFLTYSILFVILVRALIYGITQKTLPSIIDILFIYIKSIAVGIGGGIAFGIGFGIRISIGIAGGIVSGIALGIASGIFLGIVGGIGSEIVGGISLGIFSGIVFGLIGELIGGIAYGLAFGFGGGISIGFNATDSSTVIVYGICNIISIFRIYYYPMHLFFVLQCAVGRRYRFHPVAWDDMCFIPFPGLDRILVSHAEYAGVSGRKEIERLISHYPSQRKQALRAKIILMAREAGNVNDISLLSNIVSQLPKGEKGFLKETQEIMEKVKEISNLQTRINTINRAILREPLARLLYKEIENFQHWIGGFHEPLVSEFRKAADTWLKIAKQQWEEAKVVMIKEPTPQVFRAGDPVDRNNEAFVPRYTVMGDLEKQVMLGTGCPGIVLYGRRRMGKSTLLRNLSGFLPGNVITVYLSMQNPETFTSLEYLMQKITEDIDKVLSGKESVAKVPSDLKDFFKYLFDCNCYLEKNDKRLLLAVDEYENIDIKIGQNVFPEDLLATLRESIQSHRRITWIFSGGHEISELSHAPWTSYLVSARTIEVPMFTLNETKVLLTEPLKYSDLWNNDNLGRPHFEEIFWGEGGIERIHREAGGWPHLLQLIAETIVDLMNEEDTHHVDSNLIERALDKSIVSGHNVLYELIKRECIFHGEWEYLSAFRQKDVQPFPEDENVYNSIRRRLLIEEDNGQWRLRVPLMKRWLQKRG